MKFGMMLSPVLLAIVVISTPSEAQDCGNVNFSCSAHKLPWPAFTIYDMPHNDCRLCDGGSGDDFTLCHWECRESHDDAETRAAYMAVLAAAKIGDVRGVLNTTRTGLNGRVTFNSQRVAVQILSCDGNLVASLPLRSLDLVALASTLPGPRSSAIVAALATLPEVKATFEAAASTAPKSQGSQ